MSTIRIGISVLLLAAASQAQQAPAGAATYRRVAGEVEEALHRDVLGPWFPRSVDRENGGFHSHFARDWRWAPSDGKFSVFQGRMTWVAAQAMLREPKLKAEFEPIVRHGLAYLRDVMWDKRDGGFFWGLDDSGKVTQRFGDGKHLYGISFCIYGATAAYRATHDPAALELAKRGFHWADEHAHDGVNGGYFESLTREGRPVAVEAPDGEVAMGPIGPVGYKSMNTHIHLLESMTALYRVWPDAKLRARLEEMLAIVRDKICVAPGAMNLFFTNDWRAIPGHDSYGHDVETAYLMLETDEALHGQASEKTERMAKMLVDHALRYGWDKTNGGFFREGQAFGRAEDTIKEWWVQMEGLNALLLMHERYGKENPDYFRRFLEQWEFIKNHTIDSEYHGLYNLTKADGTPITRDKGSIWKGAYHDGRAFWNVSERLRRLAGEGRPDIAGTWKLNEAKSDRGTGVPSDLVLRIRVEGPEAWFATTSRGETIEMHYNTEGEERVNRTPDAVITSTLRWEGDTLVGTHRLKAADWQLTQIERMTWLADGRTLTVVRVGAGPNQSDQTLVYDRQ